MKNGSVVYKNEDGVMLMSPKPGLPGMRAKGVVREECAAICESKMPSDVNNNVFYAYGMAIVDCAKAIRDTIK